MNVLKIFFLSLLVLTRYTQQEDYREIFGDDYEDAILSVNKIQKEALTVFRGDSAEVKKAIAVVFPELIRYSMIRDFFETKALEIFYIENGKEAADYSIGAFQMKPSFIEELEKEAENNLKVKEEIGYPIHLSEKEKRSERIERLKKVQWQLRYLKTFITLYTAKEKLMQYPISDQVLFLAYAYNHGLNTSVHNVLSEQLIANSRYFPYGTKFQGKQYSYAAIALDFFKKQLIFAKK